MCLVLKRDTAWLKFLPQCDLTVGSALLIGEDGGQVSVPGALLLAASPLVRSICADHGIPPALSPIVLSIPAVSADVLQVVGEMLMNGTADLSCDKTEKIREVFKLLEVEAVLKCDTFDISDIIQRVEYEHATNIFGNSEVKN